MLKKFIIKKPNGTLKIIPNINNKSTQQSYTLVFNNGKITYGGMNIPQRDELVKMLIEKVNPKISPVAIKVATKKATDPTSVRQVLNHLVRIRLLSLEEVERYIRGQVLQILEYLLPHSGSLEFNDTLECDLCFSKDNDVMELSSLMESLKDRQQKWQFLAPTIPSAEAIPCIVTKTLPQINEPAVRQHLEKWVDGKRSVIEIAQKLDKDPLSLARFYANGVQMGWITFDTKTVIEYHNRPIILSVDDSPIIQATMKRILSDRYNLLLASNAVDALNLLNQNPVSLLLLDLTLPDIDGLKMCKTLRSIRKFKNLPIVMITARDGLINKMKGQIAGTNRYLSKPFDSEKLLNIVNEFVHTAHAS
ncbi:MAG: PleD family two-component system response regulator [Crocosphaera sp.]